MFDLTKRTVSFHREALFVIRGWRNYTLKNKTNSYQCLSANTYTCVEINGHNLVLAAQSCRNRGRPEEFLVKRFGSQYVEAIFRNLRSMTTMNHTQINFSFKEMGEKLRRAHVLQQIQHRNSGKHQFPDHSSSAGSIQPPNLPTDTEIKVALTRAEAIASDVLEKLGIARAEQSFEFSVVARGDSNWDELITSDSESDTEPQVHEGGQQVYEARDLFPNFSGQIELPHSTSEKHVYLIRDDNGKVCRVNKQSVVWMLTTRKVQETSARVVRYKQSASEKAKQS